MKSRSRGYKISLPKAYICDLYIKKKLSLIEIAQRLGCSADTIGRRLKEMHIKRHSQTVDLPMDEVVSLYSKGIMNLRELGEKYNCSRTTVANYLREYGVLAKKGERKKSKIEDTKSLIKGYKEGKSLAQLSKIYGISSYMIQKILKNNHVVLRTHGVKKDLPLKEILYLYRELHYSAEQIGKIYHVRGATIGNHLKSAGYMMRGNNLEISTTSMYEIYQKTKSISRTAAYFGCAYTTVQRRFKQAQLPLISL